MRLEDVIAEAAAEAEPTEDERRRVKELSSRLLEKVEEEFRSVRSFRRASLEGSVAKDTWIKGRAEIDVFAHFAPELSKEDMERAVVRCGTGVVSSVGGEARLRYAEHPYVEGIVSDVTINIVGCYEAQRGRWLSPVDRTPYHTLYIGSKLGPNSRSEVRVLKLFMRGIGVYGAEIKVGGFSGYLSELLIIHYGDFLNLVKSATTWRPPIVIDIEGHMDERTATALFQKAPLIVIDPVDPRRNVASAVTATRLSEFILACRCFLKSPSMRFFRPTRPGISYEDVRTRASRRGLLALAFHIDRYISPDVLWGELLHSAQGIRRRLERDGFKVYRHAIYEEGGDVVVLYELEELRLPEITLHQGPPVWLNNAEDFLAKHLGEADTLAGPWVEGYRLYILKRRRLREAGEVIKQRISEGGVAISRELLEFFRRAEVLSGWSEVAEAMKGDPSKLRFLSDFLSGRPRFLE